MLQPGRDPRGKRVLNAKTRAGFYEKSSRVFAVSNALRFSGCNFLKLAKSTLLSKGAILVIALLLIPGSVLLAGFKSPATATAAPSTNLNFQARLLTNSGNLVPDGTYHIEFKLYKSLASGSSAQGVCVGGVTDDCEWMETRTTGNLVTVVNGYFSVNLGSVTSFGSSIDWSAQHWLTMNIGGTSGPSWNGEMSPRIQLTAVPLAFMANNVNSGNTTANSTPSANTILQSGNTTGTTSNSGTVTLQSGNVTNGNSGNIIIDAGTASGTKGTLSLGATSASAITLGHSGVTTNNGGNFTVQGGGLTVGTTSQVGVLTVSDGFSHTGTIEYYSAGVGSGLFRFNAGNTNGVIAEFRDCCGNISLSVGDSSHYSDFNYGLRVTGGLLVGTSAGSTSTLTVNGATVNTTLVVNDDANGGVLGGGLAASASVDIYSSISINQTTANQAITLPTPTANTTYGRTILISNVGSVSFTIAGHPINPGKSLTLIWSNTTGGTSWQSGGTDGRASTKIVAASNSPQSVKDGADYIADGTADEVEINAALTAAAGGKVYLAEGTFVAAATILVPNNTTLAGAGNGTTIELANLDTTENLIENTSVPGTGVVIRDLRINGRKDLNTAGTEHGIYLNRLGDGWSTALSGAVINVRAENFRDSGVYLLDSDNLTLSGLELMANTDGITASTTGADNGSSHNSIIGSHFVSNVSSGINLTSGTGNTISSNTFEYNVYGISVSAQANTVTNNTFYNETTSSIYINGNSNTITSNSISSSGGATTNNAIMLYGTNGDFNYISNNSISDSSCTTTCYAINISTSNDDDNSIGINYISNGTINDSGGNGTDYVGQGITGNEILFRGANSTTAFRVQNSTGTNVLNVDTSNFEVEVGDSGTAGKLLISDGSSNFVTLTASGVGTNYTLTLPTTIGSAGDCLQNSGTAGILTFGSCGSGGSSLFTDAGTQTYLTSTTDELVVGSSSSFSAKLSIIGTSNQEQLLVRAYSGQTTGNPLALFQDSTGAELFRVNTDYSGSLFMGYNSGAADDGANVNTAFGSYALQSNVGGQNNAALGNGALGSNTSGGQNTAVGALALNSNVSGSNNVAIGNGSQQLATGSDNVSIGKLSLGNTTGSSNLAIGGSALVTNTSGNYNVAVGQEALGATSTTNGSVALGFRALQNSTGAGNLALGYQAGDNITSGANNIIIGYDLNASSATVSNELRIGSSTNITLQADLSTMAAQFNGTLTSTGLLTANAGATLSGAASSLTFSGVTTDITTAGNEALTIQPGGSGDIVLTGNSGDVTFLLDDNTEIRANQTLTGTTANDLQTLTLTNQTTSGTQRGLIVTNANDAANAVTESLVVINNAETTANTVTDYLNIISSATDTTANAINVSDSDLFNGIYLGANFERFDGTRIFEGTTGTLTIEDTSGNDLLTLVDGGTTGNATITGTTALQGAVTISGATSNLIFSGITTDITTGVNEALTISPNGSGDLIVSADNDTNLQLTGTVTSTNSNDLQVITLTNQSSSGTQRGLVLTNANDAANAVTESLVTLDNAETTANTVTDYLNITSSATDTTSNAINASDPDLFNSIYHGANFERYDGTRIFEGTTGTLTVEDTSGNDLIRIVDNGTTGNLTITGETVLATVSGAGLTSCSNATTSKLLYDSTAKTFSCGTDQSGGAGSSTLQQSYTASAGASPSILLTNAFGGITIRDGTTPVTGDLFSLLNNGGTAKYFGVSATGITLQNSSGNNAMAFDNTTNTLKVYGSSGSGYASITYNDGTSTAVFSASSGTTQIGTGTGGGGDINLILANETDKLVGTKNGTLTGTYSASDFTFGRNLTIGSNAANGNIVKIEDSTGIGTGSIAANLLYINQGNTSATGNLILAQTGGATDIFKVSVAGTVTVKSGGTYTGAGALTVTSGGANALNLDTGGGAALNVGPTNATSIVIGGNTSATITEKVANSSTTAFILQTAGATNFLTVDSTNNRLTVGASDTTGTLLILDDKTGSGDPTGVNGGMYYNSNAGRFRCYEAGAWADCLGYRHLITVASDVASTASTACQNVTGLSFPVTSGVAYRYHAHILHTGTATTIGSAFGVSAPASPTQFSQIQNSPSAATTLQTVSINALSTCTATTASFSTTGTIDEVDGVIVPSSSGTFQFLFAPETATANGVVIRAGSTLEWW